MTQNKQQMQILRFDCAWYLKTGDFFALVFSLITKTVLHARTALIFISSAESYYFFVF